MTMLDLAFYKHLSLLEGFSWKNKERADPA
jgi:hypothetical protein